MNEISDIDRLADMEARANYAETGGTLVLYKDLRWLASLARTTLEGGPGSPDECPAGHGEQCCRWPDECRAALAGDEGG